MTTSHRRRVLRGLTWAALLLMLLVTSVSAFLRLTQPRPDCGVWPHCRASVAAAVIVASDRLAVDKTTIDGARKLHRMTASLALLTALALALLALARRPRNWLVGRPALTLVALALGLSALGIITPGSTAAPVLIGNLLGGFLMVAVAWRLTSRIGHPVATVTAKGLDRWVLAGIALWMTQAALGAVSGTGRVASASIVHALMALAVVLVVLQIGSYADRAGLRREGMALIGLAFGQFLLGASAAVFGAPLLAILLHNFFGALGLALLMTLFGRVPLEAPKS